VKPGSEVRLLVAARMEIVCVPARPANSRPKLKPEGWHNWNVRAGRPGANTGEVIDALNRYMGRGVVDYTVV